MFTWAANANQSLTQNYVSCAHSMYYIMLNFLTKIGFKCLQSIKLRELSVIFKGLGG